jgi:hypothetical protein
MALTAANRASMQAVLLRGLTGHLSNLAASDLFQRLTNLDL